MSRGIFSGEPLPLQPSPNDLKGLEAPEGLGRFHFKLIEFLRRLGAKLDEAFNRDTSRIQTLVVYMSGGNLLSTLNASPEGGFKTMPFGENLIVWNDKPYTVNNGGSVTIEEDGLYLISVDTEVVLLASPPPNPGGPLVELRVMIERSGIGRIVIFSYTSITDGALKVTGDGETINLLVCISVPKDHNIRVQARKSVFENLEFADRGTRMQILQLAKDTGGGGNGGNGHGWPQPPDWPPWLSGPDLVPD